MPEARLRQHGQGRNRRDQGDRPQGRHGSGEDNSGEEVRPRTDDRDNGEGMIYLSECCDAPPIGELDMTTVRFGGPSGFCGVCQDNCIFVDELTRDLEEEEPGSEEK